MKDLFDQLFSQVELQLLTEVSQGSGDVFFRFLNNKQKFLSRLFEANKYYILKVPQKPHLNHNCLTLNKVSNVFIYSKKFSPSRETSVLKLLYNEEFLALIDCLRCRDSLELALTANQFDNLFIAFHQ